MPSTDASAADSRKPLVVFTCKSRKLAGVGATGCTWTDWPPNTRTWTRAAFSVVAMMKSSAIPVGTSSRVKRPSASTWLLTPGWPTSDTMATAGSLSVSCPCTVPTRKGSFSRLPQPAAQQATRVASAM